MAHLVERSHPTPEDRGSNPVIGEKIIHSITINWIEKTKIKKKETGNGTFLLNSNYMCQRDEMAKWFVQYLIKNSTITSWRYLVQILQRFKSLG